jgi:hypothetical protein
LNLDINSPAFKDFKPFYPTSKPAPTESAEVKPIETPKIEENPLE